MASANPLFAKKTTGQLMQEASAGHRLRPVLGPIHLTSLEVGAIIGAGIFVIIGASLAFATGVMVWQKSSKTSHFFV